MSYDLKVRVGVRDHVWSLRFGRKNAGAIAHADVAEAAINAIPPLSLKDEAGRFVKMERSWRWINPEHSEGQWIYTVVEEVEIAVPWEQD
jgi:hypothetical protein